MRFKDGLLEKAFRESYNAKSVVQVRVALIFGAVLYAIFALLDSVIVGDLKDYIWEIRFFFVIPFIFLGFSLTFTKIGMKYLQEIISVVVFVGGIGILWMLSVISPPSLYLYSQGLMLVLIFNFTFLRLRFFYSLVNGIVLLALFQLVSRLINPLPMAVFINNNFFLWGAGITGATVSYILERLERNNFLNNVLLKQLAETDGLTGVTNRNSFMSAFNVQLKNVGASISSLTFCMLDLDNFKLVNDFYGHPSGDELLKDFGQVLLHKFRATDIIGRVGGDEFGVLLIDVSDYQRIVNAFKSAQKDFSDAQNAIEPKITFSVGCVIIKENDIAQEQMFYYSLADLALSIAKRTKESICIIGPDKSILFSGKLS
ncbi:MAG: GGDEF domain-containing protein [candidate division WOR-3 bacterium]